MPSVLAGALSGVFVFAWVHQVLATFGGALAVTSAVVVAVCIGLVLGIWAPDQWSTFHRVPRRTLWLVPAAWTAAFPWLLQWSTTFVGWCPMTLLTSEASTFTLLSIVMCGLLVVPMSCVVALNRRAHTDAAQRRQTDLLPATTLFGASAALLFCAVLAVPLLGVHVLAGIAVLAGAASFWIGLTHSDELDADPAGPELESFLSDMATRRCAWLDRGPLAFIIGAELAIVGRLLLQLMLDNPYLHVGLWSGVCVGVGVARLRASRTPRSAQPGPLTAVSLCATLCPLALLLLHPVLIQLMLWSNATISSVAMLVSLRVGLLILAGVPLGWAWGELCRVSVTDAQRTSRTLWLPGVLWGMAGLLILRSIWPDPGMTLACLTAAAGGIACYQWWRNTPHVWGRFDWGVVASLVGLLVTAGLLRNNYRPEIAARLLFSTETFNAYGKGTERELLPYLDDVRLLTVVDGAHATWSVWKSQGVRVQLRRDGIPIGSITVSPHICPQFAGDVMHAAVPLAVHPQPDEVLLLGLGSSVTLSSCLACPVRGVTCVEGDADLLTIIRDVVVPMTGTNPLADDRVKLSTADATLAALAEKKTFDVILVNSSHPALLPSMAQFTQEWCRQMQARLKPGGMLCQRLSYVDLGRQPIEDAITTLRSVFPQVLCHEAAPGEILLMASNSPQPLVDASLVERCEAPHLRRLMAQVGWDWSVMLNLAALHLPADSPPPAYGDINTVANGRFAYRLPTEVMRWGPKWQEVRGFWLEEGSRMLDWLGESTKVEETISRLHDVTEQHQLIVQHPDRFWIYRDSLKQRLTERPRSRIMQVGHEGLQRKLHPEDERRREYLLALGAAAGDHSTVAIRNISSFAEPYDPLVSYFLHREAARLYEEAEHPDLHAQLDHLRYSIYFAPPQDQSVRNVVAALNLVLDHPQLIPDPQDRWDQMNGLLDILRRRSALRISMGTGASRFDVVDTQKAMTSAKRTLTAMDQLREDTRISREDWRWRQLALERLLIRPMRTHHARQAGQLATTQAQQTRIAESVSLETETQ